jgi:cell division protein FtsW
VTATTTRPRTARPAARRQPPRRGPARRRGLPGTATREFWWLVGTIAVLNLLGLVMVLSASSVVALDETGSTWSYFARQTTWATIGVVGLVVFAALDRRLVRRLCRVALCGAVLLLVAVMVPGVGVQVNGATRWLGAGPFQVPPSEFAKLALLVFVADFLAGRAREMHDPTRTFWPVIGVLALVAGLVLIEPNLGTALVLASIVFIMLFVAGTQGGRLGLVGAGAAFLATAMVLTTPFRRARFFAFLDPWADPGNTGYQNLQALVALGSGGLFGVGLGASRAKWDYLPFAQTDFIFAIIGEELGLVGAVFVVGLFVVLGVFGVRTALAASDRFSMLLSVGITSWFLVQAFLNIGMVIGLLPITGVPLPFISFGGSSLLVSMCAAGLLLNVARHPRTAPRRS